MSEKQFEDFLAEKLSEWGKENLISGYRYQFQSPDARNSAKLFKALSSQSTSSVLIKNIEIPLVVIEDINLLIVMHSETENSGFGENFISHIRDVVAAQQGEIKNSSLLVIHKSQLDTLINSAENIAQNGFVWHPSEIMQALFSLIEPSDPAAKVSKCLLNHRFDQIVEDGATMFGFEELYKAMRDDGDLRFDEIGLLNDPVLNEWDLEGQINARLEKNKQLYEKIDYIVHNFPTSLEEKLGEQNFGPAFVKKHFSDETLDSWKKTLEFRACEQEQQNNKDNMLELEKEIWSDGYLYSRAKTDTKAGRRDKHLIYLLEEQQTDFQIAKR
jgi:DNA phosphorothioation-dependent restriction protein DptH